MSLYVQRWWLHTANQSLPSSLPWGHDWADVCHWLLQLWFNCQCLIPSQAWCQCHQIMKHLYAWCPFPNLTGWHLTFANRCTRFGWEERQKLRWYQPPSDCLARPLTCLFSYLLSARRARGHEVTRSWCLRSPDSLCQVRCNLQQSRQ